MEVGSPKKDMLLRLLDATEMRSRVAMGNLANQSVPGYTRKDVKFEDLLRTALDSGQDTEGIQPTIIEDLITPRGDDGNNVSLELETNTLRENRIRYELYAAMLQGRGTLKQIAVSGGR
jgi:flagellar basal-body rod protein FlgB